MAVTLIATPGDASANSFTTLAEADAYHDGHPFAETWNDAETDKKRQVLILATRLIKNAFTWKGAATYPTVQALPFPRYGVFSRYLVTFDPTVIPQDLKDATAEFARLLLTKDFSAESSTAGIKSLKAGSVAIDFDTSSRATTLKMIPDIVIAMIGYLAEGLDSNLSVGEVSR